MPDLTGRIEGEKMGLFGKKKVDFVSPAGGRLMNITEVADPAFSSKMLGDGFAVDLTDGEIGAPFDGEECLIHVGMDTVQLNGKGFDVKVKQGQMVKKGDTLVVVDLDEVRAAGKSLVTPVIFTDGTPVKMLKKDTQISRGEEDILKF